VPEGRRLFPRLTVEENLLLGAFRRKARAVLKSNLAFCFECFPRLAERRGQLAGSMSGGEQQMLALARALMLAPRILLIDEPSVGLAPILISRTIDKIKELKDRYKLTVLMAEQNFPQLHRRPRLRHRPRPDRIRGQIRRRAQQQRADTKILSGAVSALRAPPLSSAADDSHGKRAARVWSRAARCFRGIKRAATSPSRKDRSRCRTRIPTASAPPGWKRP
jgi:hypothetical protein